jgi:hypothetical protein
MRGELTFRLINKKKFILLKILSIFVNLFLTIFQHNNESQLHV